MVVNIFIMPNNQNPERLSFGMQNTTIVNNEICDVYGATYHKRFTTNRGELGSSVESNIIHNMQRDIFIPCS